MTIKDNGRRFGDISQFRRIPGTLNTDQVEGRGHHRSPKGEFEVLHSHGRKGWPIHSIQKSEVLPGGRKICARQ
jgi:hypothetical protein